LGNKEAEVAAGGKIPRVVISAAQGHSGKTTVSIGLCAAFAERGLVVQPFKKGVDYIDPSWLTAAAGRDCRNLDVFLMPEEAMLKSFRSACRGADLAVIEGVMGLYDSPGMDGKGSTAYVARKLGAPVILIVNASRMTRSVAAVISGYQHFEPETNIAGIILNNVSTPGHKRRLLTAVEKYCNLPVLGCIPPDVDLRIGEQHLGLRPHRMAGDATSNIRRIHSVLKKHLDLEGILTIARKAEALPALMPDGPGVKAPSVRIGVVFDKAFNFYYPENLEALCRAGAELVFINSLTDTRLPEIDGLYIGGGFPELFGAELEANRGLREDIAQAVESEMPVYAECAGLMYLCRGIRWHDEWHEMVGIIPSEVELCLETQGHGYVVAEIAGENPWLPAGTVIPGHQFHHSRLSSMEGLKFACRMKRRREHDPEVDGIIYKNLFAAYTHLHALGVPQWAESFVSLAKRERAAPGNRNKETNREHIPSA